MNRLLLALKALRQLGPQQVGQYALYRIGLLTGHYRRLTSHPVKGEWERSIDHSLFPFPSRADLEPVLGEDGKAALLAEADEIVGGKARLFGAEAVELRLAPPAPLAHWTAYETGKVPLTDDLAAASDIKWIWEPARFGWAFTLGRAFHLTGEEKYAETFWRNFETFAAANPPFLGPHWMSGQEVALRLMAFVWAAQAFEAASVSTPERKARLADSVGAHAARIPPTLVYARAQHNNHLLTEAAGLLTAGLALPGHPESARWRALGWKWLNHGLQSQIDSYGEYAQHSANYHRLMLQVVLWANALLAGAGLRWPRQTLEAVQRSVHWLLSLMDSESGRAPNLGANDGAYLFPLTVCPFADYRPVAHAAARAFLDYGLPRGPWDEMALWFGVQAAGPKTLELPRYPGDQIYGKESWAYLRAAQFTSRPSHADQLHLDLWWRGLNVAQDAGTYLYNAPAPWNNSLTTAFVHNTVTVDGRDQFTRAGRFLYLDWFNAYRASEIAVEPGVLQRMQGHYRMRGFHHARVVAVWVGDRWLVQDEIRDLRGRRKPFTARLHWLLPDWEWEMENGEQGLAIRLQSPHGPAVVTIHHSSSASHTFSLCRGGKLIFGSSPPDPTRGWVSPTYGVKTPALSLAVEATCLREVRFTSEFTFPAVP